MDPVGLQVRTGLDYSAVVSTLWAQGHRRSEIAGLLDDLHACEVAAIDVWHDARERRLRERNGGR